MSWIHNLGASGPARRRFFHVEHSPPRRENASERRASTSVALLRLPFATERTGVEGHRRVRLPRVQVQTDKAMGFIATVGLPLCGCGRRAGASRAAMNPRPRRGPAISAANAGRNPAWV